jgi:hypothetical protein
MPSKSIFKSKTIAVNFVIAIAGLAAFFVPSAAQFVKDHAAMILTGIGAANTGLRIVTHGKVTLFGSDS